MTDQLVSSQIYLSRDQVRAQITEYLKSYLELENIDLTKSSFLSFVTNIISTLTSNLLFYETAVYKEFFLTKAQLPESILNLSAFLGYNTTEASYATCDVLMTIPFGFEDSTASFEIANGFKFYAKDIEFRTYYDTTVYVSGNSSARVTLVYENKAYDIPVSIDTTNAEFSFILPTRQYKVTTQQFQIDSDLQPYQFTDIEVAVSGEVSSLTVEVTPPGSSIPTTYTEFESLFLMSSTDYGYVSRRTSVGRKIYFGNGLIGIQPDAGSTVDVTVYETLGQDGNVISGSINKGDRIYITVLSGQTKIVDYTCTNASPAINGEDEESVDDVRSNSIKNLVSMSRFVSETDFQNTNVIIPSSPLGQNSLAVLKRSDIKCNEIQLFTTLSYNDEIVPTRNEVLTIPISQTYVPKYTVISSGSDYFYTIFDMNVDLTNGSAYYDYVLTSISATPVLNTSYTPLYTNISITTLDVSDTTGTALFELNYTGTDTGASCVLEVLETGLSYSMTHDTGNKKFTYEFNPYTSFPDGETTVYFTISSTGYGNVAKYSSSVIVRESLNSKMMSNVFSDSTSTTIYDIPVVEQTYYDNLSDKDDFELQCIQSLISSTDFENYRMMTDFVNLKFSNTTGEMVNMKYNTVNRLPVLDIISTPPGSPTEGDRYIVGQNPTGSFSSHTNQYAQYVDSTADAWYFSDALTDDIVYIVSQDEKYIFTGSEWIVPVFNIPLEVKVEVFKSDNYFNSDTMLASSIKSTLLDTFSSRFGINSYLYRSEVVQAIQAIDGVEHCNLLTPKSNIFYNFKVEEQDLTQDELLVYSPEYLYFTEDSISVTII